MLHRINPSEWDEVELKIYLFSQPFFPFYSPEDRIKLEEEGFVIYDTPPTLKKGLLSERGVVE